MNANNPSNTGQAEAIERIGRMIDRLRQEGNEDAVISILEDTKQRMLSEKEVEITKQARPAWRGVKRGITVAALIGYMSVFGYAYSATVAVLMVLLASVVFTLTNLYAMLLGDRDSMILSERNTVLGLFMTIALLLLVGGSIIT